MAKKKIYQRQTFDWEPKQLERIIEESNRTGVHLAQCMRNIFNKGMEVTEVQETGYSVFICSLREDLVEDIKYVANQNTMSESEVVTHCLDSQFKKGI